MFRLTNKLLLHQLLPLFFQVNSNQWKSVNEAEWKDGSIVALIQWIPQLTKTTMPSALRQRLVSRMLQEPLDVTSAALTQMDESQLEELVQWSDMVVFDYLTGNYDRVASMQVRIICLLTRDSNSKDKSRSTVFYAFDFKLQFQR